jgi:hypothetical protein
MRREVPESEQVPGAQYAFSDDAPRVPVVDVSILRSRAIRSTSTRV